MDTKALRQKILDLAIRGKLVLDNDPMTSLRPFCLKESEPKNNRWLRTES